MHAPVDVAVADLARRQYGVVALAQLVELGLSARAVQHRMAAGRLHRIHRGVYAVGHRALLPDGWRLAAALAGGPRGVLSHRSAGAVWQIVRWEGAHEVLAPIRSRSNAAGIELHQTRSLPEQDRDVVRGIPVTSVARTLVDLAAVLRPAQLERALHAAETARLFDLTALDEVLARSRGRRGTGVLRALLLEPSAGDTESPLEERFLELCRDAGLPRPRCNVWFELDGLRFRVDALFRPQAIAVELDGRATHGTRSAFEADRRRDAALASHGYLPVRFTYKRLVHEADVVADELRRVLTLRTACI